MQYYLIIGIDGIYAGFVHRNINVSSDDNKSNEADDTKGELVSDLNCKVWVRFETYDDFYGAMKVLCGRSMEKVLFRFLILFGPSTWNAISNCILTGCCSNSSFLDICK